MEFDIEPRIVQTRAQNSELFGKFDPARIIAFLDEIAATAPYHQIPSEVERIWQAVTKDYGESGFEAFQHVTLLMLIADFDKRRINKQIADSVLGSFDKSFSRIVRSTENENFSAYRSDSDILLKDLALCRLQIFPAGAQVVEPSSSFHRTLIFRGGLAQASRMIQLLLKTGGNDNWYQIHTHLEELEDFNPEGWSKCYLRLADMLKANPNVRGMWGGSWFYDPALENISPRLGYLRHLPERNGAQLFYSNVEIDGGALSKSKARVAAYECGDYLPRSYVLIWPRRNILQWADSFDDRDSQ